MWFELELLSYPVLSSFQLICATISCVHLLVVPTSNELLRRLLRDCWSTVSCLEQIVDKLLFLGHFILWGYWDGLTSSMCTLVLSLTFSSLYTLDWILSFIASSYNFSFSCLSWRGLNLLTSYVAPGVPSNVELFRLLCEVEMGLLGRKEFHATRIVTAHDLALVACCGSHPLLRLVYKLVLRVSFNELTVSR